MDTRHAAAGLRGANRLRGLAALGAGALLCSLVAWLSGAQASRAGEPRPRVWAADRDAHQVVGLDRDLVRVQTIDLAWPLDVEVRADGGLWVLRSGGPGASFGRRLCSLSSAGAVLHESWLESAHEIQLVDGRDILVIEHGTAAHGADRVWRIEPDGRATILFEDQGLACVAPSKGGALLGWRDGRLARIGASARTLRPDRVRAHPASWRTLGPGPNPGTAFALDGGSSRRLVYLDADLAQVWSVDLTLDPQRLGVVPGEERVWLADAAGSSVRRYGPSGVLEFERTLPVFGADRALVLRGVGVLCAAPGAIVRLDPFGQILTGQGGFQWLADLAAP